MGKQKKGACSTEPKWNEKCILLFQFPGSPSLDTSIIKNLFQKWELEANRYTSIKIWKKTQKTPQKQPS